MRILIASHAPLDDASAGTRSLAPALTREVAGHSVRALVVDCAEVATDIVPTRRIICRRDDPSADLPFDIPRFGDQPGDSLRFADLTDAQIAAYRESLRQALDAEIVEFDPQIVHCDRIWLLGHLALESGVPYVLAAHESELVEASQDHRYRRLAEEAAENAGRILVPHEQLARQVRSMFGDLDGRITVVPRLDEAGPPAAMQYAARLLGIYAQVLHERRGGEREV